MATGAKPLRDMVDLVGIEPTTSSMPWKRAPSCATGPLDLLRCNSRLAWSRRQTGPRYSSTRATRLPPLTSTRIGLAKHQYTSEPHVELAEYFRLAAFRFHS